MRRLSSLTHCEPGATPRMAAAITYWCDIDWSREIVYKKGIKRGGEQTTMIHEWKTNAAQYPALHRGKEYILYVRENGSGVGVALQDAWNAIAPQGQDRLLALLNALATPSKHRRAAGIEEEFSFDVQLPPKISRRIWLLSRLVRDEEKADCPKVKATIDRICQWLDQALQPILEASIPE